MKKYIIALAVLTAATSCHKSKDYTIRVVYESGVCDTFSVKAIDEDGSVYLSNGNLKYMKSEENGASIGIYTLASGVRKFNIIK